MLIRSFNLFYLNILNAELATLPEVARLSGKVSNRLELVSRGEKHEKLLR